MLSVSPQLLYFGELVKARTLSFSVVNSSEKPVTIQLVPSPFTSLTAEKLVISGKSRIVVKATLRLPVSPCNISDQILVLCKNQVLAVDVLASVRFDDVNRPPVLLPKHLYLQRELQLAGLKEYPDCTVPLNFETSDVNPPKLHAVDFSKLAFSTDGCPVRILAPAENGVVDFGALVGNLKSMEVVLKNTHETKSVLVTFSDSKFPLHETLSLTVHPELLEIQPGEERSVHVTVERTSSSKATPSQVLLARLGASVCFLEDAHYMTASSDRLLPPWTLGFAAVVNARTGVDRSEPEIDFPVKLLTLPATTAGRRSTAMLPVKNRSGVMTVPVAVKLIDGISHYTVSPEIALLLPGETGFFRVEVLAHEGGAVRGLLQVTVPGNVFEGFKIPVVTQVWDQPDLRCPQLLGFPSVLPGESCWGELEIGNPCDVPVEVRLSRPDGQFAIPIPVCVIAPGAREKVKVKFLGDAQTGEHRGRVAVQAGFGSGGRAVLAEAVLVGRVVEPDFRLSVTEHDLGTVITNTTNGFTFSVKNEAAVLASYSLRLEGALATATRLGRDHGTLIGSGFDEIAVHVQPEMKGEFQGRVVLSCNGQDRCWVDFRLQAVTPQVRIVSVRGDESETTAQLWQLFEAARFNELMDEAVTETELTLQRSTALAEKLRLWQVLQKERLAKFTFPAAVAEGPNRISSFFVTLRNEGSEDAVISLETLDDFSLEDPPQWAATPVSELDPLLEPDRFADPMEAHMVWVERRQLFHVEPRQSFRVPAGGGETVLRIRYRREYVGVHRQPLLLTIVGGKTLPLLFEGECVEEEEPRLELVGSTEMQPVAIDCDQAYLQTVQLVNRCGVQTHYVLDTRSLEAVTEKEDYEVWELSSTEGILLPNGSVTIQIRFFPREAKLFVCDPVIVSVRREFEDEHIDKEVFRFSLSGRGFDPREEQPAISPEMLLPRDLPWQTREFPSEFAATLSAEVLDFGSLRVGDVPGFRLVTLQNRNLAQTLHFAWTLDGLDQFVSVEPAAGSLAPGDQLTLAFRVQTTQTGLLAADAKCQIRWTPDAGSEEGEMSQDRSTAGEAEELIASHSTYPMHELGFSKNNPLRPLHVSVANRLTVSRFRALMASPGGQKFLADNLHSGTALLSAYLPSELTDEDIKELLTLRSALTSTASGASASETLDPLSSPLAVRLVIRVLHAGERNADSQSGAGVQPPKEFLVEFGSQTNLREMEKLIVHEPDVGKFFRVDDQLRFPYTIPPFPVPKSRIPELREKNVFLGSVKADKERRDQVVEAVRRSLLSNTNHNSRCSVFRFPEVSCCSTSPRASSRSLAAPRPAQATTRWPRVACTRIRHFRADKAGARTWRASCWGSFSCTRRANRRECGHRAIWAKETV